VKKKPTTTQDSKLFRQAVGKVMPIKAQQTAELTPLKPKPFPKAQDLDLEEKLANGFASGIGPLQLEDSLSFLTPGVQKNVLKKLRKATFDLDEEIDLHGLSSQEAKRQLLGFLHACVENGKRCVHIIHGKGLRSPDQLPVLKNQLNLWLRQHRDVLAFCSSSPKRGGTGAVNVLLRLADKYRKQDDA